MCMTEEMPRNSESQMISKLVKWLKRNHPEIKVLFTWADGMLGRPGYVYQASNFIYAGYSGGEMYMKDNVKIHVRQMKRLLVPEGRKDERLTVRPSLKQMKKLGIRQYRGKQYRYLMFLCDKKEKRRLIKECKIDLGLPNPKQDDLSWRVRNVDTGKWEESQMPNYKTDADKATIEKMNREMRVCDVCGKQMTEGFIVDDLQYFCSEKCLHTIYSDDEYQKMYEADTAYWTQWEDEQISMDLEEQNED